MTTSHDFNVNKMTPWEYKTPRYPNRINHKKITISLDPTFIKKIEARTFSLRKENDIWVFGLNKVTKSSIYQGLHDSLIVPRDELHGRKRCYFGINTRTTSVWRGKNQKFGLIALRGEKEREEFHNEGKDLSVGYP